MKIFEKQSEIICRLLYSENLLSLSHSIHGRGMKKNVNAKCGYVMQKYYLCSRKAAPDCTGVYSQPQKKKKERCSSG